MVLSPDSEFFRFFRNPAGVAPGSAPAGGGNGAPAPEMNGAATGATQPNGAAGTGQ
jgi:modulator of FtsH protease HflC